MIEVSISVEGQTGLTWPLYLRALTTSLQHAPPSASARSLHPPGRGILRGILALPLLTFLAGEAVQQR